MRCVRSGRPLIAADTAAREDLLRYSVMAILIFMLTSKMLSPQFLVWLLPLVPLVSGSQRYGLWTGLAVTGILTALIFPRNYVPLLDLDSAMIMVLLARNLLLMGTAVILSEPFSHWELEHSRIMLRVVQERA